MAYQGRQPGVGVRNRFIYSATNGQTSFSGADSNGLTLAYADATYVDVFLNGVLLVPVSDYAATTKTSVVLGSGAAASDIVEIVAYDISSMSDAITSSSGGTITGNLTVEGNFSADGGTIKLDGNYPVGTGNVALGDLSFASLQSGASNNVSIGYYSGNALTTGDNNTALGAYAVHKTTTASGNTGVGRGAMYENSTGASNTAIGDQALYFNTTADANTAVGYQSIYSNTTGSENTAIGYNSLYTNTTGSNNSAIGRFALRRNTTGDDNASLGLNSMENNTTGSKNTGLGRGALINNTTASNNTAVGYAAGEDNTTGTNNTYLGSYSGKNVTTANHNTFVGSAAGELSTASGNTFIGYASGWKISSGANNTILGRFDGNQESLDIRTSSNNIVLSDGDGNPRLRADSNGTIKLAHNTSGQGYQSAGLTVFGTNGETTMVRSGASPVTITRQYNDGHLVDFYQDTGFEGYIAVSGTTVSYNGGHLSRESQLLDGSKDTSMLKGTVMTNLDQMAQWTDPSTGEPDANEQLNCMAISSVEGDTNVAGVFVTWDEEPVDPNRPSYTSNDMRVAMTGDMIIRIAQGTTVTRGDLLMSAGDGTAKSQGDDIVRSKTIAKVTSTHVSNTYDDGSYCVPCVLMAC